MLAGKLFSVHPHATGVERADDQSADNVGTEAFFADVLLGAAAAVENPGAGAEVFVVEGVCDLGVGEEACSQFEDAAERCRFSRMRTESLERFIVDVAEGDLPARPRAALRLLVEFDADFFGGV